MIRSTNMSIRAHCILLFSVGTIFCALLTAQNYGPALHLIVGFQATGSQSAWAWGKDLFAQEIETRKFHLLRVNDGKIVRSTLPRELATPVEDLDPGASFLDSERGFVVWTENRVSDDNGVRFTLATAETLDAGHSWQERRQTIRTGFTFTGVNQLQFTDSRNGHLIVGVDGAMGSTFKTLLHTRDGGAHWEVDPGSHRVVGDEDAPIYMVFLSKSEGWVLTAGVHDQPPPNVHLAHTSDGGSTWRFFNKFAVPLVCRPNCSVENVSPIYFKPANLREGFFVVSFQYATTGSVPLKQSLARYRTHDGGAT